MATVKRFVAVLAVRLLRWAAPPVAVLDTADDSAAQEQLHQVVTVAVWQAFVAEGLNSSLFSPSFNLVPSGKIYPILFHAAELLNRDHELQTVGDIIDWLALAPSRKD